MFPIGKVNLTFTGENETYKKGRNSSILSITSVSSTELISNSITAKKNTPTPNQHETVFGLRCSDVNHWHCFKVLHSICKSIKWEHFMIDEIYVIDLNKFLNNKKINFMIENTKCIDRK